MAVLSVPDAIEDKGRQKGLWDVYIGPMRSVNVLRCALHGSGVDSNEVQGRLTTGRRYRAQGKRERGALELEWTNVSTAEARLRYHQQGVTIPWEFHSSIQQFGTPVASNGGRKREAVQSRPHPVLCSALCVLIAVRSRSIENFRYYIAQTVQILGFRCSDDSWKS